MMGVSLRARALVAFLAALLPAAIVYGQDYPTRPIHVIVGPGPDIVARLLGPKMTEVLGQSIIVEPRPGAGGVIAAQTVATAPPDGYSLLLASASYTINTALRTSPYDLRKAFAPVGLAVTAPFVLVVNPSVPATSVADLIALAKSRPGQLNYASAGVGTPPHLAGELFKQMAGIDIVHVPYREANSALNAVISGSVQMMFAIASTAQSQIKAGTVRGLGVTSLKHSAIAPDMTPVAESGLPGFEVIGWNGYVAPRGTPADVVAKLNSAVRHGLADADLRNRLQSAGYEPVAGDTPETFAKFIEKDTRKWIGLVESTNMRLH